MSKPVVYLKEIERVGDVIETLQVSWLLLSLSLSRCDLTPPQTTTHNLFPIMSKSSPSPPVISLILDSCGG
jgi:hypothetical protein